MQQIFFIILGLAFGSFASVLIDRAPWGRSRCPACKHQLSPFELIPVLSFVVLLGKCRNCKKNISALYPVLELSSAALFYLTYTQAQAIIPALILALALWLLLVISVIDIRTQMISDLFNIPLVFIGILYSVLTLQFSIWSILIGGGFFAALYIVSRGKWIGSGDIILGAGIGALLGRPELVVVSLFLTYVIGAVIVSGLLALQIVQKKSYIAFAPLLALGALLTILFEDRIAVLLRVYFGV